MFTGIIQKKAKVLSFSEAGRLVLENPFWAHQNSDPIELGESVACNGVCLTVVNFSKDCLEFDVAPETRAITALGALANGTRSVNLERSLRLGDRLSGHWVQGHVDGVAKVASIDKVQEAGSAPVFNLFIELPDESFLKYCVKKGSFSLEGISLTVHEIVGKRLWFQIIPHTWEVTALSDLSRGDLVNFEVELFAKYVERMTIK